MLEFDFDASNLSLTFSEVVESRRNLVDEATGRIMRMIRAMPCARGDLDDIALALTEALANNLSRSRNNSEEHWIECRNVSGC